MPVSSMRMPAGVCSVTSTSAIRLLLVASQPGNSMPAALRITLRPPSAPTRYRARSGPPSARRTSTPVVVLGEPGHLAPPMDRHAQLLDPAGQDPLDVVLPQAERVRMPGREVADVQRRAPEGQPPGRSVPRRGTGRRSRAGRGSRWCASGTRRPGSPPAPASRGAPRSRRRPPPAPARRPASSRSGRPRPRSRPPHDPPSAGPCQGSRKESEAPGGSCRKPLAALYVGSGRELCSLPSPFSRASRAGQARARARSIRSSTSARSSTERRTGGDTSSRVRDVHQPLAVLLVDPHHREEPVRHRELDDEVALAKGRQQRQVALGERPQELVLPRLPERVTHLSARTTTRSRPRARSARPGP